MYRYRILIVDDDRLLQNSLRAILTEKYDPLIAGSGEEALRLLKKETVDLVLLDIRLPGIDGLETLQRIKALDGTVEQRAVFLLRKILPVRFDVIRVVRRRTDHGQDSPGFRIEDDHGSAPVPEA